MQTQITKESEAWLALAAYHDEHGCNTEGLCTSLGSHYLDLPPAVRTPLHRRIADAVADRHAEYGEAPHGVWAYAAHYSFDCEMTTAERRDARVLACLMFAAEAESEGR